MTETVNPVVRFRTFDDETGILVGVKGEDTLESLFELLLEKYGARLDVEAFKKANLVSK